MLYEPLTFRNGVRARNRTWLAPMTNQMSHADGSLSDDELRWLEMRARGGFGVIETCAAHVALDGQAWPGELGAYDDRLLPGLRRLASAIGASGALGIVQLFHGGARASSQLIGEQTWSASSLDGVREATATDIAHVIGHFGDAAARCHAAGFHGIELHGAHGFLFTQFLSTTMNRRSDDWGGSLENRARLLRAAMHAVRAAVPASFVVGVRLSPEDHGNVKGIDLDESLQVARWLCDDGADFVHLSLWDWQSNTRKRPESHAAGLFRAALPNNEVIVAAGGVWTRDDAEALLEKGATAIAIGRAAIANPDWATKAAITGWSPRRPPVTKVELLEAGLSPGFVEYMRNWKGFVAQPSREAGAPTQAMR